MKWFTIAWAAVILLLALWALGWFVGRSVRRSDGPLELVVKLGITIFVVFLMAVVAPAFGLFGVIIEVVLGLVLGIMWAPSWGALLAKPLTSSYDGGRIEEEPAPTFAIIEAKRKLGKYAEALEEAREQLARFPTDYQVQMLIAEIQAKDMSNLTGAIETIERFLEQSGHLPGSIAYALGRVADWSLEYRHDRAGAKAALERIVALLPNTAEEQIARQRIAHLASEEMLAEKGKPHRVALRHYEENIGLLGQVASVKPPGQDPPELAADYVKHLAGHPADNEVREKLAMIYADHYQRLDLVTREFEQLIAAPNQQSKHVVRWLSQLSDLQISLARDAKLARATLQRIVDLFPGSAAAETAIARMRMIERGIKRSDQPREVKMGKYQSSIGLD